METIHEQIKHGMALAFFASAYADQADECCQPLRGEIIEQLPADIDPAALHAADTLAHGIMANNMAGISASHISRGIVPEYMTLENLHRMAVWLRDANEDKGDRELAPEIFGHYCAMQAMGHGVGLESFGSAVADNIAVPFVEFGSYSLQKDYFQPDDTDEDGRVYIV